MTAIMSTPSRRASAVHHRDRLRNEGHVDAERPRAARSSRLRQTQPLGRCHGRNAAPARRLLLLGKGGGLANRLARPLAADSDDEQQRRSRLLLLNETSRLRQFDRRAIRYRVGRRPAVMTRSAAPPRRTIAANWCAMTRAIACASKRERVRHLRTRRRLQIPSAENSAGAMNRGHVAGGAESSQSTGGGPMSLQRRTSESTHS